MSPADRLGVVQCGGDQVVEVDEFDVEGLAHMGAAVAQNLHDLGPVLHRIEMGFDRLRRVVTSLSASAVAKILTRIMSMAGREHSRV